MMYMPFPCIAGNLITIVVPIDRIASCDSPYVNKNHFTFIISHLSCLALVGGAGRMDPLQFLLHKSTDTTSSE